jgi:HlyD family secretion protein
VAASLQAPVLFVIANDLSRMQVNASIDEADVGRVRAGEDVTFHVDAYPNDTFTGRVDQVRLQPITVQNVVTYNTLIAVDNPGGRLMPGMTATVSVIVQRRDNVLRLPAAALRFRPEGWQPGPGAGGGRRGGAGASGAPSASTAPATTSGSPALAAAPDTAPGGGRGGGNGGGGGAGRGAGRGGMGGEGGPGGAGGGRPTMVFVPGPDGKPKPQPIRTGINDGQWVEVVSGLDEGTPIITGTGDGTARAGGPRPGASPGTNPFAPQPQRRTRG